jgi:shikimate kinase
MDQHLFLTGFRGTGKSTVARILAESLGMPCVDLDQRIQEASNQSIAEIFTDVGEAGFRKWETDQLATVAAARPSVISLGGGAVLAEPNRAVIGDTGVCVWLTASADSIVRRISADTASASQRPALTPFSQVDEVRNLLAIREPIYRGVSDWQIDTESGSPPEIAARIANWLRECGLA